MPLPCEVPALVKVFSVSVPALAIVELLLLFKVSADNTVDELMVINAPLVEINWAKEDLIKIITINVVIEQHLNRKDIF